MILFLTHSIKAMIPDSRFLILQLFYTDFKKMQMIHPIKINKKSGGKFISPLLFSLVIFFQPIFSSLQGCIFFLS